MPARAQQAPARRALAGTASFTPPDLLRPHLTIWFNYIDPIDPHNFRNSPFFIACARFLSGFCAQALVRQFTNGDAPALRALCPTHLFCAPRTGAFVSRAARFCHVTFQRLAGTDVLRFLRGTAAHLHRTVEHTRCVRPPRRHKLLILIVFSRTLFPATALRYLSPCYLNAFFC